MSTITARANVAITKGHPFQRNRYSLYLFINDMYTGLSWSVNRKQARTMPQRIVDNAALLLETYGLMDAVYGKVSGHELPAAGTKVRLTGELGPFPKGHVGTVVTSYWDEGVSPDNQYPVTVALSHGDNRGNFPVSLSEFEVVK